MSDVSRKFHGILYIPRLFTHTKKDFPSHHSFLFHHPRVGGGERKIYSISKPTRDTKKNALKRLIIAVLSNQLRTMEKILSQLLQGVNSTFEIDIINEEKAVVLIRQAKMKYLLNGLHVIPIFEGKELDPNCWNGRRILHVISYMSMS